MIFSSKASKILNVFRAHKHFLAMTNKTNINTDLCVDIKTKLIQDHIAKKGKYYDGLLRRDSEYHFTFIETAPSPKGNRSPQVYKGDYITITRSKEGLLRINLKEVYITDDFSAEKFSEGVSGEIKSVIDNLVEK